MLLIINKKPDSNRWDYPETPELFIRGRRHPSNPAQLIADYIGARTPAELGLAEYGGSLPTDTEKRVTMAHFGELLPDAVLVELEDFKNDTAAPAAKRQAAARVLMRIASGVAVDVNAEAFEDLLQALVTHTSLTGPQALAIAQALRA